MKKLLTVLLASLMVFSLAACSSKKEETSTKTVWKIGTSPDYPPFENLTVEGTIEGFDIDMVNTLVSYLDGEVEIELVQIEFDNIVSAVQAGTVDIGLSAFSYDPDRAVIFSTPYVKSSQAVVVKKDSGITAVADLEGLTIAAQSGTTGYDAAVDLSGAAEVIGYTDNNVGMQSVISGHISAYVVDKAVADAFCAANSDCVVLEEMLTEEEFSFIVKLGNTELEATLNELIDKFLQSPDYQTLKDKWNV